jgi:hypothetical protein
MRLFWRSRIPKSKRARQPSVLLVHSPMTVSKFATATGPGSVKPQEPALIAVNLYAGNQYWFAAAADADGKKVGVKIYDETGNQVTVEKYEADETAAAGFSPENSGQYFVSVSLLEGESGSVCLVCSYK